VREGAFTALAAAESTRSERGDPAVVYHPTVADLGRLERRLLRAAGQAVKDFDLIAGGDRILVAVSGGKDSYTLLHVLMRLRERAAVSFDLVAVNLD
jgi:hypothetical protein